MTTTFHDLLLLKPTIIRSGAAIYYKPEWLATFLSIPAALKIDCIYLPRVLTPITWEENFFFGRKRSSICKIERIYNTPGTTVMSHCFKWKFLIIQATFNSFRNKFPENNFFLNNELFGLKVFVLTQTVQPKYFWVIEKHTTA